MCGTDSHTSRAIRFLFARMRPSCGADPLPVLAQRRAESLARA
jgi:hypothetical protein